MFSSSARNNSNRLLGLPKDIFSFVCTYLSVGGVFLLAETSTESFYACLAILTLRIKKDCSLPYTFKNDFSFAMRKPGLSPLAERQLALRAYLHVCLKLEDGLATGAASGGQVQILRMLYQQKGFAELKDDARDLACSAALAGQARVLDFLHENAIDLNNPLFITKAIRKKSAAAIRSLSQASIDFSECLAGSTLTAMQLAMDFSFAESDEMLQKRFQVFLAMLECGSYPKEGKESFMSWMQERFYAVQPVLCSPYSSIMLFASSSSFDVNVFISDSLNKISQKPAFELAYKKVEAEIEQALEEFALINAKRNKFSEQVFAPQIKSQCEEKSIELTTFKRSLV